MKNSCQRLILAILLICSFLPLCGMDGCNMKYTLSGQVTGDIQENIQMILSGSFSDNTTTDTEGIYIFENLDNGSYTITPSMLGYTFSPASQSITIPDDDIRDIDFFSVFLDVSYMISGSVSGDILGNVSLSLTGAAVVEATTDEYGDFSIEGLDNGTYTVTPSRSGYTFSPASRTIVISGTDLTDISFSADRIPSTYSISGTVSGDLVEGVTLSRPGSGEDSISVTTDANGDYSFTGLKNGSYTITPWESGYTFAPSSQTISIDDANETGVDFTSSEIIVPTYLISGIVTGDVQAGVTITLSGAASDTTTTDINGGYSFTGLLAGSYTVTPGKTGYVFDLSSESVTITGSDVTGVDFTADKIYLLSGTVLTAIGAGVENVTLTLSGSASDSTMTDASGDYTFTGLLAGSYTVTPGKSGYAFDPANQSPVITGSDVTGVDFTANSTIPELISPADGATGMDNSRDDSTAYRQWDFSWGSVVGATNYNLYVKGPPPAMFPIIDIETSSTVYTDIECTGWIGTTDDWTWKVRAYVGGAWQPWSETWYFDVEPVNTDGPESCPP